MKLAQAYTCLLITHLIRVYELCACCCSLSFAQHGGLQGGCGDSNSRTVGFLAEGPASLAVAQCLCVTPATHTKRSSHFASQCAARGDVHQECAAAHGADEFANCRRWTCQSAALKDIRRNVFYFTVAFRSRDCSDTVCACHAVLHAAVPVSSLSSEEPRPSTMIKLSQRWWKFFHSVRHMASVLQCVTAGCSKASNALQWSRVTCRLVAQASPTSRRCESTGPHAILQHLLADIIVRVLRTSCAMAGKMSSRCCTVVVLTLVADA